MQTLSREFLLRKLSSNNSGSVKRRHYCVIERICQGIGLYNCMHKIIEYNSKSVVLDFHEFGAGGGGGSRAKDVSACVHDNAAERTVDYKIPHMPLCFGGVALTL